MRERPLSPRIQAAAVFTLALIGDIVARREVQILPILGRLIRPHTGTADLGRKQAGNRQRVVAYKLSIEAETTLPGKLAICGIDAQYLGTGSQSLLVGSA